MEIDPIEVAKRTADKVDALEQDVDRTLDDVLVRMQHVERAYVRGRFPSIPPLLRYDADTAARLPATEAQLEDPTLAIMPVDARDAAAWDELMANGGHDEQKDETDSTLDLATEPREESNDDSEQPTDEQPAVEQPTDEQPTANVASDSIKDDQRPDKPRNYRRMAGAFAAAGVIAVVSGFAALKGGENEAPSAVRPVPESPVAGMLDGRSLPPLMKSIEKSSKENRAENNKNDKGDKSSGSGSVSSDTNTNGRAESAAPRQQTSQGNAGPVETVQTAEPQRRTPPTAPSTEPAPPAPSPPPQRQQPQSTSPFLLESGDPSVAGYGINNQKADPNTGGTPPPR